MGQRSTAEGKLAWQPTDTLDVLLVSHHYKSDDNCCSFAFRELDPRLMVGVAPVAQINPSR